MSDDEWDIPERAVRHLPYKPLSPELAAKVAEATSPEVMAQRRKVHGKAVRKGTEGAWREMGSHTW